MSTVGKHTADRLRSLRVRKAGSDSEQREGNGSWQSRLGPTDALILSVGDLEPRVAPGLCLWGGSPPGLRSLLRPSGMRLLLGMIRCRDSCRPFGGGTPTHYGLHIVLRS